MVIVENNKVILSHCPNFDRIVNTDFLEDDNLSLQLVKIYRDLIFKIDINNGEDIDKIKILDMTMGKYVDDYFFRKTLQKEIFRMKVKSKNGDPVRTIVDAIINIYKQTMEDQTRKIYISKWI